MWFRRDLDIFRHFVNGGLYFFYEYYLIKLFVSIINEFNKRTFRQSVTPEYNARYMPY